MKALISCRILHNYYRRCLPSACCRIAIVANREQNQLLREEHSYCGIQRAQSFTFNYQQQQALDAE